MFFSKYDKLYWDIMVFMWPYCKGKKKIELIWTFVVALFKQEKIMEDE